ncbi:MAG: NAD-dependent epimerase/dehydratase family protein [Verrucomicrobia bacterium]|nr:NAD-dependent epimerase/dehydratase family protein [Verrucomicrobiota bacterium]MBU1735462.1 NAD-dependent epimerase/dehydratase family protein [Verrucomicrobiota bacterium]MBU1856857.1 NAD-dependent epimerase/dehydratase family protein [Verrucomicrobiota bacterium]
MYKGARVLVTGGAGFVGSNLVRRLVVLGAKVRATVHIAKPMAPAEGVDYLPVDLLEADDCAKACKDKEYVFLCAAVTSGAAVMEKTPLVHLTPNLIMNARMLEAAYSAGVRKVLFISSNTVYPVTDYPVRETDCTNEFYEKYFIVAWMKRFSEIICEMYAAKIKKPMQAVVVRPANIYGPFDKFDWETSHVLPALIRRVVERHDPIQVWGDGKDIKDFIYVDDLVEGLLLAMEKINGFDPINLASGRQYCLRDLLDLMLKIDGYENARVVYDASKPTMIPKRLIDPTKAKSLLGFEVKTPVEEGLRKTIEWYRGVWEKTRR